MHVVYQSGGTSVHVRINQKFILSIQSFDIYV